ncbi:WD40 repeat domain-containing protein [Singulisphaera sp. PoT]|uniref:WD40 repeat domain-containing protein n=1 Tax=Singulisphaera sp. PoT TaxID=3411797 RepID=UPI003BF48824
MADGGLVDRVAMSPDGGTMVRVCGRRVDAYSTSTGGHLVRLPDQEMPAFAASISKSGRWLAPGSIQKYVSVTLRPKGYESLDGLDSTRSLSTGVRFGEVLYLRPSGHLQRKIAINWPGETPIIGGNGDQDPLGGRLSIRDLKTGKLVREILDLPDTILAASFLDDESGVATFDTRCRYRLIPLEGPIRLDFQVDNRIFWEDYPSAQTVFAANGLRLASIEQMKKDHAEFLIKLLDAGSRQFRTIAGRGDEPWTIAISPNGKTFATADRVGVISLWDFDKGEVLRTIEPPELSLSLDLQFGDDGKTLASCTRRGRVHLWNLDGDRLLLTSNIPDRDIRAVALDREHLTVVSGGCRDRAGFRNGARVGYPASAGIARPEPLVIHTIGLAGIGRRP